MTIVPKITYTFQMLPIYIPQIYFRILKTIFTKFIWQNKKPRIKYSLLCKEKKLGGLAAPDLQKYYNAIIIARVMEWTNKSTEKRWVKIERNMSKAPLEKIIWIPQQYRSLDIKTHSLTKHALKIWDKINKLEECGYNSPLIPLKGTKYFPPGNESPFGDWIKEEDAQLKDILVMGRICTYQELKIKKRQWKINEWRYLQLRHFVEGLPQPLRTEEELNPLEKLSLSPNKKKGISKIYKILLRGRGEEVPPFIEKWENELGTRRTEQQVKNIFKMVYNNAIDNNTIEINYKCLSRWYITPDIAHKYQKEKSPECWRGCKEVGNMSHIWWGCPKIKLYWSEVLNKIKEITEIEIPEDPWICLFHVSLEQTKCNKQKGIVYLLDAAKSIIPRHWLDPEAPKISEWIKKVDKIYFMEYLRHAGTEDQEIFNTNWEWWTEFKKTRSYAGIVGE